MTTDPDYIAQAHMPGSSARQRHEWFNDRAHEAHKQGIRYRRASHHPDDPCLLLFEGWKERPEDDGPLRWQMTAA